jgi:hypothetical protein
VDEAGEITGTIDVGLRASVTFSAEVVAGATIQFTQKLGASLLADAAAEAGIVVDQVLNVVYIGGTLSGQVVTPECRTFNIVAEVRTFNVTCQE